MLVTFFKIPFVPFNCGFSLAVFLLDSLHQVPDRTNEEFSFIQRGMCIIYVGVEHFIVYLIIFINQGLFVKKIITKFILSKIPKLIHIRHASERGLKIFSQVLWQPKRLRMTLLKKQRVKSEKELKCVDEHRAARRRRPVSVPQIKAQFVFIFICFKYLLITVVHLLHTRELTHEVIFAIHFIFIFICNFVNLILLFLEVSKIFLFSNNQGAHFNKIFTEVFIAEVKH